MSIRAELNVFGYWLVFAIGNGAIVAYAGSRGFIFQCRGGWAGKTFNPDLAETA